MNIFFICRIIMSMLCGDPYSVENVLGPLLSHQQCYLSGDRSLTLETQFCDSKRKVEVILSSYHSAMDFRDELIHGFILVNIYIKKSVKLIVISFSKHFYRYTPWSVELPCRLWLLFPWTFPNCQSSYWQCQMTILSIQTSPHNWSLKEIHWQID